MLDRVNSAFLVLAVLGSWADIRRLRDDRRVAGTTLGTAFLLVLWPLWDLCYYSGLGQAWSLAVCVLLVFSRFTWVSLAILYARV